jgi:hypothetical protein
MKRVLREVGYVEYRSAIKTTADNCRLLKKHDPCTIPVLLFMSEYNILVVQPVVRGSFPDLKRVLPSWLLISSPIVALPCALGEVASPY